MSIFQQTLEQSDERFLRDVGMGASSEGHATSPGVSSVCESHLSTTPWGLRCET